ncbi:MAG: hypothetical protein J3K34DRAFT_410628 [Monoraphidium minutum]|nr:MAG: hypothetical protein J3K34DRAFT_410628 [Monoraphidium minutum]
MLTPCAGRAPPLLQTQPARAARAAVMRASVSRLKGRFVTQRLKAPLAHAGAPWPGRVGCVAYGRAPLLWVGRQGSKSRRSIQSANLPPLAGGRGARGARPRGGGGKEDAGEPIWKMMGTAGGGGGRGRGVLCAKQHVQGWGGEANGTGAAQPGPPRSGGGTRRGAWRSGRA